MRFTRSWPPRGSSRRSASAPIACSRSHVPGAARPVPRLLALPFYLAWTLDRLYARDLVMSRFAPGSGDRYTDFEWVSAERHFDGAAIETGEVERWAWWELPKIDPSAGATRAELDAFRLVARFIAHSDNKQSNQRLVWLASPGPQPAPCPAPFAFIQDRAALLGRTVPRALRRQRTRRRREGMDASVSRQGPADFRGRALCAELMRAGLKSCATTGALRLLRYDCCATWRDSRADTRSRTDPRAP